MRRPLRLALKYRAGYSLIGVLATALTATVVEACGESRSPIGEECLRNDDCLSSVCAARTCVPAPSVVTGATDLPPDEEPRIPDGPSGANVDASTEGG